VDASGRSSRAGAWLAALGYAPLEETVINAHLAYTTRWYRRPNDFSDPWKGLLVRAMPPNFPRGGVIVEVENGLWIATLSGFAPDVPPREESGFLEFARSLAVPDIYAALHSAEPVSPHYGYQRTENQLRHFERLERLPEGFVVLGDAVSAFNPVYGQGMTVAVLGALALNECLTAVSRTGPGDGLDGLSRRFQDRLARVNQVPWLMATAEDFRWPTTVGGRPNRITRFMHWYLDQVLAIATRDNHIMKNFLEVSHLLRPPGVFFHPNTATQVLAHTLRGRKTPAAPPAALAGAGRRPGGGVGLAPFTPSGRDPDERANEQLNSSQLNHKDAETTELKF
jgi:hypothetical protein